MPGVKIISFYLAGVFVICFAMTSAGQTFKVDAEHHLQKANNYININPDSLLYFANSGYYLSKKAKDPNLQLDALSLIINAHVKSGRFSKAIKSCLIADSISSAHKLLKRTHEVTMYKGLVFQNAGFVLEGLDYLFHAQEQIEENSDESMEADLYYYIALAYYNINEFEKCRNYAQQAINIEQEKENSSGLIKNYIVIANSFYNIDSIQYYLRKAKLQLIDGGRDYKKAIVLNNEALLLKSLGKIKSAKSSYNEAILISQSKGYNEHLANLYNNYAYLLMNERNFDSAAIVLDSALKFSKELENIDLEASIMDTYSDYHAMLGDSATSFKYYKNSVSLRNQFKEKQRIEQSLFLSTVFETEKKEKEIARQESKLYQINTILFAVLALFSGAVAILFYFRQKSEARKVKISALEQEAKLEIANALIEGQDAERKRLAMDLHDGIGPRIGVLRMKLDKSVKKNKSYDEIVESVTDIGRSIRDMSHRMLPPQLESKGLVKALENMIYILERNNKIRFTFYTNLKERLKHKLEVNLFYLSYEIINNAVKHSNGKEINIQLLSDNESLSLSVEDDGIGFNASSDYNGIGLKNIRQRVKYLEGKLTLDTEIGYGTAIIIEVKL